MFGKVGISIVLCLLSIKVLAKTSRDPFRNMNIHTLQNGMKVVLAPDERSQNVMLKLVVGFGNLAETKDNIQAGHVLEHMLFKDGSIEGDKSYLEVIKEAGGDVNAYVTADHTAYHTNIPADKAEWLLNKFKTMLFSRTLDQKELELGKASVALEIGKPFIVNRWINSNPVGYVTSNYFPEKDFWEDQFGMEAVPYSRENQRLGVGRLTLDEISKVYNGYYYPSNMTMFISGKFNPQKMISLLNTTLSDIPDREGKKLEKQQARFLGDDYEYVTPEVAGGHSSIYYGVKFMDLRPEELLVLDAYLNYVAHRLMIELRNKKGETYTAYSDLSRKENAGYAYVYFKTPSEKYEQNKNFLEKMVLKEGKQGYFDNSQVKKAIDLYLKERFEISDVNADSISRLAEIFYRFKTDLRSEKSPYELLTSLSEEDFRLHLKKIMNEQKSYIVESREPLFFEFDLIVFFFISLMMSIFVFKAMWTNRSEIGEIKWSLHTSSSPGMVMEVVTLFIATLACDYLFWRPLESLYENSNLYTSSMFLQSYLSMLIGVPAFVGLFMWMMSRYPSKVLFTGDKLVVKHFILKETCIDPDAVTDVKIINWFQRLSPQVLFKARFSVISLLLDCYFWRKSALITFKDNSLMVLHMKDSKSFKVMVDAQIGKSNSAFPVINQAA